MTDKALTRIVFMLLAAVGFLAYSQFVVTRHEIKSTQRTLGQLHNTQISACESTNVSRATDNRSHWADYVVLRDDVAFTRANLAASYRAEVKLHISQALVRKGLRYERRQLREESAQLRSKTWTQLSNCATRRSGHGILMIHRISQYHPPRSQMRVRNALKLTPAGSV